MTKGQLQERIKSGELKDAAGKNPAGPSQLEAELINLYHLAKVPTSGNKNSRYDRMLWAAKWFSKEHPKYTPTAAYKMLDRILAGGTKYPWENNGAGVRIVYNRLLGGWYVVTGPHQTPLNGRFNSKEEAQAWLNRKNPRRNRVVSASCLCGNKDPSKFYEYDGSLGYEAIVCKVCGRYYDLEGSHAADAWSKGFLNRKNPASDPGNETDARELELFIENDADLYRQQYTPIIKNLMRKRRKGVYDFEKSVKLFMYLVENGAKKYNKEISGIGSTVGGFNKNTRLIVARSLADKFKIEADLGNYDDVK